MTTLAAVFGCLHDGIIAEVTQESRDVHMVIDADHVGYSEHLLTVLLKDVSLFEWSGHEADDILEGAEIQSTREEEGGGLSIAFDCGLLALAAKYVILLDEIGDEIPFSTLENASNAYWESFQK